MPSKALVPVPPQSPNMVAPAPRTRPLNQPDIDIMTEQEARDQLAIPMERPSRTPETQPTRAEEVTEEDANALAQLCTPEELKLFYSAGLTLPVLMQLVNKDEFTFTAEQSIQCILSCIQVGQYGCDKAKDRDVILVIGDTGAGKSTALNYLAGCTMKSEQQVNFRSGRPRPRSVVGVDPTSPIRELMPIGHRGSKTFIPTIGVVNDYVFCDCPGFYDSRGSEINISNAVNIRNVLKAARSVKILICINYGEMPTHRFELFRNLKTNMDKFFNITNTPNNFLDYYRESILFALTKVPMVIDEADVSAEDAIDEMFGGMVEAGLVRIEDRENEEDREHGKIAQKTVIIDPLGRRDSEGHSRTNCFDAINNLTSLPNPAAIFKTLLTAEEILTLVTISRTISSQITEALQQGRINDAYGDLRSMKYLEVIENEEVTRLYGDNLKAMEDYFRGAIEAIRQLSGRSQYQEADQRLSSLLRSVALFKEFNPQIESNFLKLVSFNNDNRLSQMMTDVTQAFDQVLNDFNASPSLQEKQAYSLHKLLNLGKLTIHGEQTENSIVNFLTELSKLDDLEQFEVIKTKLARLKSIATRLQKVSCYQEKQDKLVVTLQQIATSAKLKHNDLSNAALKGIKLNIVRLMPEIKASINWKKNGSLVLGVLSRLDIKNLLETIIELENQDSSIEGMGALGKEVRKANEIILTLSDENELKALPRDVYLELSGIKARLEEEKDQAIVNDFINKFKELLTSKSFENMDNYFKEMASFTSKQKKLLKQDETLGLTLKGGLIDALRSFESQIKWKQHGSTYLVIFEEAKKIENRFKSIESVMHKMGNEVSMKDVGEQLSVVRSFYRCMVMFANAGQIESGSFLDEVDVTFSKIHQDFIEEQKQEQVKNEVDKIIVNVNNSLIIADKWEEIKHSLIRLKQIAPEKLGLTAVSSQIQHHVDSFNELLKTSQYAAVKRKLQMLESISEMLGEFFEDLKVTLDIPALKKSISDCSEELHKEAKKEIDEAFNRAAIANTQQSVRSHSKLEQFFAFLEQQDLSDTIVECRRDVAKHTIETIDNIFKQYNGSTDYDAEVYTKLLMQVECMTCAIGSKDIDLIKEIRVLAANFVKNLDKDLEFLVKMEHKLSGSRKQHGDDSKYASEVISKYPEFQGASNRAFIEKTKGRRSKNIIEELTGVEKEPLTIAYKFYEEEYLQIHNKIHEVYQSEDKSDELLRDAIKKARTNGNSLKADENYYRHPKEVALMLANIFGAWSYLEAHSMKCFMPNLTKLKIPHSSQVIGIFLLFGLGGNQSMQNHLIEIKTGEGKSIASMGAAISFALIGFVVDIACYGTYLVERDAAAAKDLIQAFGLTNSIHYGDFGNIIERCISVIGDLRAMAKSFVEKKDILEASTTSADKRLLFVDEVDVLFSEKYLGVTHNPSVALTSNAYKDLLLAVWDSRERYVKMEQSAFVNDIKASENMNQFSREYPGLGSLIDSIIMGMYQGLKRVHDGSATKYLIQDGKIGYVDETANVVMFNRSFGSQTAFAAIKEYRSGNISETELNRWVVYQLRVGFLSYAELPKGYRYIIGVTGTLFQLGVYEEGLLKENNIELKTAIPTLFSDKKSLPEECPVKVFAGELDTDDIHGYFLNIKETILAEIKKDRAILVIFETEERLQTFHEKYSHLYNIEGLRVNLLCVTTPPESRSVIIEEAARRKTVTLMTYAYGRGSDFVCADDALRKSGGVAVITTFFPKNAIEETQYKGRTCRQNDPGTFEMILHLSDLAWLNVNSLTLLEQESNGSSLYKVLNERRRAKLNEAGKATKEAVEIAKSGHDNTLELCSLLRKRSIFNSKSECEKAFKCLESFNAL